MKIEEGKPHMTLPNGDKVYEGEFARTRDGRKVKVHNNSYNSKAWPFYIEGDACGWHGVSASGKSCLGLSEYDLIAEWTDTPKLWCDMTPEEKGALLLAHHEGRVIECHLVYPCGMWSRVRKPSWNPDFAYRIRPEPKRETVTLYYRANDHAAVNYRRPGDTHRFVIELEDENPASIRMGALK